jgi:hypothetical protein
MFRTTLFFFRTGQVHGLIKLNEELLRRAEQMLEKSKAKKARAKEVARAQAEATGAATGAATGGMATPQDRAAAGKFTPDSGRRE